MIFLRYFSAASKPRLKVRLQDLGILKVVGNENGGGLGGWLLFEDGFGPWRSVSVCFSILLSSFNEFPFPFCNDQLIGDWCENRRGAPNF